jgi:hypothetical protein
MLRYGFEVTLPKRVSADQWRINAIAPDGLSRARLLRLCNLIDRTPSLALLVSVNVRIFRWLGLDRRQPELFYRLRRARYLKAR